MAGLELVLLLLAVSAGLRLVAERLTVPYAADVMRRILRDLDLEAMLLETREPVDERADTFE